MEYDKNTGLASDKLLSILYKVNKSRNTIKNREYYWNCNYLTTDIHSNLKTSSCINQVQNNSITQNHHSSLNKVSHISKEWYPKNKSRNYQQINNLISPKEHLLTKHNKNIFAFTQPKSENKRINKPKGKNQLVKKCPYKNNCFLTDNKTPSNGFHRHIQSSDSMKVNKIYDRFHLKTGYIPLKNDKTTMHFNNKTKVGSMKHIINDVDNAYNVPLDEVERKLFDKKINNIHTHFSNGNNMPSEIKNNEEQKDINCQRNNMNEIFNNQSLGSLIELKELHKNLNEIKKKDKNGNHHKRNINNNKKREERKNGSLSPFRIYPSNIIGMNYDKKLLYVYKTLNNK